MAQNTSNTEPTKPLPAEPHSPSTATATPPAPAKAPPSHKPLDQYKVLLHNDDFNEMMYVVQAIVEVCPMPSQRAFSIMAEAHSKGLSLVAVTHLELAELYQERFKSKRLTATIEKA